MTFGELLKNQPEVIKLLVNSKKKEHFVHAYIFEGDSGTGTLEAAKYFAMLLLCHDEKPCLTCNICERIMFDSHLNVSIIEPIDNVIRKEQISLLKRDFSMTSAEEGAQIYIIKDAEKMNTAAANSILKFLEEPIPNHYAVLLTKNHNRILDTIVSRAQLIHFKPVPKQYFTEQLMNNGATADIAYIISHITSDLAEAKQYIEEGKLIQYINLAKKVATSKFKRRDTYVDYYLNKKLLVDPIDKKWHFIFFDTLILIYQEMIKKLGNVETKYFTDVIAYLKDGVISRQEILDKLSILNEYEERLNYNVNLDLLYTSLFTKL